MIFLCHQEEEWQDEHQEELQEEHLEGNNSHTRQWLDYEYIAIMPTIWDVDVYLHYLPPLPPVLPSYFFGYLLL